jgi:hypothetical protein
MSQYQAMQDLGGTISSIGFKFAEKYQAQQKQLQGYKAERSYQKFQNDVVNDVNNYEQEADPSGENFYKNYNDRYEKARTEFESTVPADLLPEYQVKTEGFKGQIGSQVAQKEVNLRNNYYETTLNADVDGLASTVINNPSMSADAWSSIETQVEMSGLSPTKKAERLQVYRSKINEATVQGFVGKGKFEEARDFIEHLGPAPSVLGKKTENDGNGRIVVYEHVNYGRVKPNVKSAISSVSSELEIPLRVTSGFRDLDHPSESRKGPRALHRHTTGTAVDLDMKGYDDQTRAKVITGLVARGATGLGVYKNSPNMIHVDWSGLGAGAKEGGISAWYGKDNIDSAPKWFKDAYDLGLYNRRNGIKTDVNSNVSFVDVTPNTMNEENWSAKNYARWEFGGPELEMDTPVVTALDLMTSSLGHKLPFKAKQDSIKIRLNTIPESQRDSVIKSAISSGFSGLNFSSDEKGEFVTMRVDTAGVTNKPDWLTIDTKNLKSVSKQAGVNSKFIPRGNPDADRLMEYIEKGEIETVKAEEKVEKENQSETAKAGWDLFRKDTLDDKWLEENKNNLSEVDYRMFTQKIVEDKKKAETGEEIPYKVDQSAFVDLMSRASDPKDVDVIKDAIEAQTNKSISKTDFNKIYDRTQKTLTPGKLGKEAEWKSRTRKYVIDKIRPIDEEDTTYLEGRLEAANEFDTYLEEHPDVTSDIAKAQADAIIAKHVKSSNVDKRATLDMGPITAGRYQVTMEDISNGARQIKTDFDAGTIDQSTYTTEMQKLVAWKKLLDEEGKNN